MILPSFFFFLVNGSDTETRAREIIAYREYRGEDYNGGVIVCHTNLVPIILSNFYPKFLPEVSGNREGFWRCDDAGNLGTDFRLFFFSLHRISGDLMKS